jgi:hypothetical protein
MQTMEQQDSLQTFPSVGNLSEAHADKVERSLCNKSSELYNRKVAGL